jgi:hypothetical protein
MYPPYIQNIPVLSSANFLGSKMSGKKKLLEREQKLPYSEM